jgi:hypothetical protein
VLAGEVLATLDGPEGFRTVMEAFIDGFVAVEEEVASVLRPSLFAVLVFGNFFLIGDNISTKRRLIPPVHQI